MANVELVLRIKKENQTFVQDFISGLLFRRTIEMQKLLKNIGDQSVIGAEQLDTLVDYVVELFEDQFTRDQFYRGIEAEKIFPTIISCVNAVANKASNAAGSPDPN